ncbi:proline-rich protein 36-like [Zingiber officinale]|uniref:proline-rich protein 36-like n=1 Tax=Zingiber officinale TaxID=94328 RepID=UPI001C4D5E45|nr:proline-rich protein 36-like [Zingiber officinale]
MVPNSCVSTNALLPAFMYKNTTMTKSFVNNLGEEWLQTRRANLNSSTLGLLSEEEQKAEAVAAMEEEEEQPFIALVKKPRLTEDVPFSDLFGTFVQIPIAPAPISFERAPSASASERTVIPSVSSQPLALALPPLASGPRAKQTPCRRSSPSAGPSAIRVSTIESAPLALPPPIPSSSSSAALVSTTSFPPIVSSSSSPSSSSVPSPLFKQALGLPSQMGQTSDPLSYGSL